jgi:hypothetical protein
MGHPMREEGDRNRISDVFNEFASEETLNAS